MGVGDLSIVYHCAIVLALLWVLSYFHCCPSIVYFASLVYLYQVHTRSSVRLRKKLQFEERKQAYRKRLLSDSETVWWLNHAVEKVWPVFMEQIASQKILLPIIPWFLEKYKPWTAKKAVVQQLYLGRTPPLFTEIRVLRQASDDDHLVLELGMNFLTSDDMSAVLAVKLRRRLGFGIWAKMHMTAMHVEGKVLVGLKFLPNWPFVGRIRLCFVEPPYFQMTVKPIVNHGLDVADLPGIAGWLDKLLAVAFEQTLVEPNMLVVDMEKFVSPTKENWFFFDEIEPIAYAKVEVVEAIEMKPSDPNGLADPYVKGQLGPYRFQTKTQKKTLAPKWHEEFKIPICTWESPNVLALEVRDKDHFIDDTLGNCSINITDLRDGKRHDMWLSLKNIKMGRLRLAVTVINVEGKAEEHIYNKKPSTKKESTNLAESRSDQEASKSAASENNTQREKDNFEAINIEGQQQTGIWVHHPGSNISQTWEPRKPKVRQADIQIHCEERLPPAALGLMSPNGNSSSDEDANGNTSKQHHRVRRSLQKLGLAFNRSPRTRNSSIIADAAHSPRVNLRAANERGTNIKFVVDDSIAETIKGSSPEKIETCSPGKMKIRDKAKSIIKHAEHGLKHVLSVKHSNKSTEVENQQQDYDSSDEMSSLSSVQYTPTAEGSPINSNAVHIPGAESHDSKDEVFQACNSKNTEEPLIREVSLQSIVMDTASCSDVHDEGQTKQ
ncbi:hypothetical protein Scep_012053 [Stephania cephalantha]|uniref:C2 domain-containing protein n=1 Tax=Stephania cephalantha TaxID=152367 RepID=A0AAP0JGF0_9MAGN